MIELKNLKKTYFSDSVETPVLKGISLGIEKGEFVAIMGPSGSGKSTLLHMMGFLDELTSGIYNFEGKPAESYSKNEVANIRNEKMGFIFQAFNLLPKSSVLDNVKLPLFYSKTKESNWDKLALSSIEKVGLSHRVNYEANQLSGGEKQRVAIARALVNNPEVIFADEPTGNLDTKSGGQIMEILESINEQGKTIILITHETYTAQYAQRIIHLKDGILESDEQVKERKMAGKDQFIK
ncbi:ABC transporter ATP-binding protein [Candidatus Parcubacteria bacterium]|nr:ABC transporter ATP-binding protein [Candidatus Parcubacteria bacterium]